MNKVRIVGLMAALGVLGSGSFFGGVSLQARADPVAPELGLVDNPVRSLPNKPGSREEHRRLKQMQRRHANKVYKRKGGRNC